MLPFPYCPDRLLQPIRTHGFATLNTTLYYRESFSLTVTFDGFCLRAVGAFWPSGSIPLVARRAFITGEYFFGGSPGLLLQVIFLRWVNLLPFLFLLGPPPQ